MYPIRFLDHHGVLHGARAGANRPFCADFTNNGAPYGCSLHDEVGPKFIGTEADPDNVNYCPICYPKE